MHPHVPDEPDQPAGHPAPAGPPPDGATDPVAPSAPPAPKPDADGAPDPPPVPGYLRGDGEPRPAGGAYPPPAYLATGNAPGTGDAAAGPGHLAPPPPPARRGVVLLVALVGLIIALCAGVSLAVGIGGASRPRSGTSHRIAAQDGTDATTDQGMPVRDGSMEFTLRRVTCGLSHLGGRPGDTATGQYCVAAVNVTEVGTAPGTFTTADQEAYSVKDIRYRAAGAASLPDDAGISALPYSVRPGHSVLASVVFDVPRGDSISRLILRDTPSSPGATVMVMP